MMKSDELNATMQESPGRYTNPFLSDEENDDVNFWSTPELEPSIVEDDFTNSPEDEEFLKSLASCDVPSEFFEQPNPFYTDKNVMECQLPELMVCYKDNGFHVMKDICVDEGLPHEGMILNMDDHEVFFNSVPVNGDKHDMVQGSLDTQLLKQEQLKSSSEQDSCFGMEEKIDSDLPIPGPIPDHKNMDKGTDTEFFPVQDGQNSPWGDTYEDDATKESAVKAKFASNSVIPNELTNASKDDIDDDGPSKCAPNELNLFIESNTVQNIENCGPGNSMQTGAVMLDSSVNLLNDASAEQLVSGSMPFSEQDQPPTATKVLESSNGGVDDVDQQPHQSPVEKISKNPFIGSETEELGRTDQTTNVSDGNKTEQSITSNFDIGKPATSSGPLGAEDPDCVHELPVETQSAPNHRDMTSGNVTIANQLQHGEGEGGESSFSVADPISSVITYSGSIPFSGSISLRSDSSTTSVRSFAFPILQTEWNSSPVRMAKGERRHLQKHRGWRQALLCCKF